MISLPGKSETERTSTDAIMARIYLGDGNMLTPKFSDQYNEIMTSIDEVRSNLGLPLYTLAARVVLANQMHLEALRHKDHTRNTGANYFDTHIMRTTSHLIEDQHLTGLPTLISALGHDTPEDIPGIKPADVMKVDMLLPHTRDLEGGDRAMLQKIQGQVAQMVQGLTKLKTKEATIQHILDTMRSFNVRIGNIKLADRTDNMETLNGHAKEEKRMSIARETDSVYRPLAHFLGVYEAEAVLTELCAQHLNPKLLAEYWATVKSKGRTVLNQHKESIESRFLKNGKGHPAYIEAGMPIIVPHSLMHALNRARLQKPMEEISLDDLEMDDRDPQFDIVVLVREKQDIKKMIGRILERFSSESENDSKIVHLGNSRGMLLKVFNKKFGGRLYFRVNDVTSEAHSKRGALANSPDRIPSGIGSEIERALQRVGEGELNIYGAVDDLTKMKKRCYTPENERMDLPSEATALDFARRVHGELLLGIESVSIGSDPFDKMKPFSLFRPLPNGSVVGVKSFSPNNKKGGKLSPEEVKVQPEWLLFCQVETGAKIREYLRKLPADDQRKRGEDYMARICEIFQIPDADIIKILTPPAGRGKKTPKDIMAEIGTGSVDMVKVLEEKYKGKKNWKVAVEIVDTQGVSVLGNEEFGEGIVKEGRPTPIERSNGKNMEVIEVSVTSEKALRALFKAVLCLSNEKHNVELYPFRKSNPPSSNAA